MVAHIGHLHSATLSSKVCSKKNCVSLQCYPRHFKFQDRRKSRELDLYRDIFLSRTHKM